MKKQERFSTTSSLLYGSLLAAVLLSTVWIIHNDNLIRNHLVLQQGDAGAPMEVSCWSSKSVKRNHTTASSSVFPTSSSSRRKPSFPIDMSSYDGPVRAYPKYNGEFPCFPADGRIAGKNYLMKLKPASKGLLFQRPVKTGSTTLAGTVMRIAHKYAKTMLNDVVIPQHLQKNMTTKACLHRSNHGTGLSYEYAKRDRNNSFLFSIIRNPTTRSISQFFHFEVSVGQKEPTDETFQKALLGGAYRNYYIRDLSLKPIRNKAGADFTNGVQDILNGYDFIGITERFDESLVVLKMLLGLDFEDILYVKERSSGMFSNGPPDSRPCIYVIPSMITSGMNEFFHSEPWLRHVNGDILMYQAASKSMDLTIEQVLGQDEFDKQLDYFLKANRYAQDRCKSFARPMCDEGGHAIAHVNRTCYIWGEGCSHGCLDEINLKRDFDVAVVS